jgi:hypothetical protein
VRWLTSRSLSFCIQSLLLMLEVGWGITSKQVSAPPTSAPPHILRENPKAFPDPTLRHKFFLTAQYPFPKYQAPQWGSVEESFLASILPYITYGLCNHLFLMLLAQKMRDCAGPVIQSFSTADQRFINTGLAISLQLKGAD